MSEEVIFGAIASELYKKYGSVFLTREEVLEELRVSRSTFDKMVDMQVSPRVSRVPSPSGTGKVLYHISDVAQFKFQKEEQK